MDQQEEGGWPLGLQPLNVRVRLPRNGDFSGGSVSFNTLHTASPASSTDSSSDLDTESTGSFFHDRSITLGSLIGASNILNLSRKSSRAKKAEAAREKKSGKKTKAWLFSLCSRNAPNTHNAKNDPPSLGHFLAVERRAANGCRRNSTTDERSLSPPLMEWNPLFVNGRVAPPGPSRWQESGAENGGLGHGRVPVIFSCMCG